MGITRQATLFRGGFDTPRLASLRPVRTSYFLNSQIMPLLTGFSSLIFIPKRDGLQIPVPIFPLIIMARTYLSAHVTRITNLGVGIKMTKQYKRVQIRDLIVNINTVPQYHRYRSVRRPNIRSWFPYFHPLQMGLTSKMIQFIIPAKGNIIMKIYNSYRFPQGKIYCQDPQDTSFRMIGLLQRVRYATKRPQCTSQKMRGQLLK